MMAAVAAMAAYQSFLPLPFFSGKGFLNYRQQFYCKCFSGRSGEFGESLMTRKKKVHVAAEKDSSKTEEERSYRFSETAKAKMIAVVEEDAASGLGEANWEEVMKHMSNRIRWIDEGFELIVFTDKSLTSGTLAAEYYDAVRDADIMVVVEITEKNSVKWLLKNSSEIQTRVCFNSDSELKTWLGGIKVSSSSSSSSAVEKMKMMLAGSSKLKAALKILETVTNAWNRKGSDNICFTLLLLIDSYASPVKLLKNLRATNLSSVICMTKNCGKQIVACLLDPKCRQALNCLNNCAPSDQVCSYRCIVSYECPSLEAFSLCVLQKHNCLGLTAEIQREPKVMAMAYFRGEELSEDVAEDLLIGWLGKMKWSWRVVAGQNAAYDHFPRQYQLFYRARVGSSMWYDPVFQVETMDGRRVWRRRHYKVLQQRRRRRRRERESESLMPGIFDFSVLDNGVVSKEVWKIVDVKDDLSWGLFYYSGAAAAAGQSYTGAILVTPDGLWPCESESERINGALHRCGIRMWELYSVDNHEEDDGIFSGNIPLNIPEQSPLHRRLRLTSDGADG